MLITTESLGMGMGGVDFLTKIMVRKEQGLNQDLETGCPKLAIVKFWDVQIFKGDHNIFRFQP